MYKNFSDLCKERRLAVVQLSCVMDNLCIRLMTEKPTGGYLAVGTSNRSAVFVDALLF